MTQYADRLGAGGQQPGVCLHLGEPFGELEIFAQGKAVTKGQDSRFVAVQLGER